MSYSDPNIQVLQVRTEKCTNHECTAGWILQRENNDATIELEK